MKNKILILTILGIFILIGIFEFGGTSETIMDSSKNHAPMFINNTLIIPNFAEVNKPYVLKAPVRDLDGDSVTIKWYLDSEIVSTNKDYTFVGESEDIYTFHNLSVVISDGELSRSLDFNLFVSPKATAPPTIGSGGGHKK